MIHSHWATAALLTPLPPIFITYYSRNAHFYPVSLRCSKEPGRARRVYKPGSKLITKQWRDAMGARASLLNEFAGRPFT